MIKYYLFMKNKPSTTSAVLEAPKPALPRGPSPWPILGCIPEMCRNRPAYKWIHRLMKELDTEVACIRLGSTHVISVSSLEMTREILKKHDAVFASRPMTMATHILSSGYLTIAVTPWGEQWRKMRRTLMSNVFTRPRLAWLLHKRNQEADNLVRFVYNQSNTNGGVVDLRTATLQYPTAVMRRMMFDKRYFGEGRSDGGPGVEEEEHVKAIFTVLLHIYAFSVADYLPWLKWLDLDGYQKKVSEAMNVINKYQDPIIHDRVRQWRDGMRTEPEDLLDVFISLKDDSNGKPLLSTDEIRAQITEVFLAAADNPYSAAEWALSEMLNQPRMLQKATEEVDRVVGKDRLLQESDIPQLPYITACAREALRLHPVAPFNLPHVSLADCTVGDYFIPKGSTVLISRLGLNRNPAVWDDPLRFDPDRHLILDNRCELAENELRFISFSTGRRGCIGVGLGSNITVMLLGRLLQGFTWNIPHGMDKIDLSEEAESVFKGTPLYAHAKPRLNPSVYLSLL
ncbi:Cytochrome P450, E-class, group I [Trema orientale]|uniref:Cytochrome P450, E-class, group I n=1 Tax=Trema orientale TaxID=63057 RepID=A0A2P5B9T9_TREOI|nr:Cytochrome P450, E-class, group I [Trema orientale]